MRHSPVLGLGSEFSAAVKVLREARDHTLKIFLILAKDLVICISHRLDEYRVTDSCSLQAGNGGH